MDRIDESRKAKAQINCSATTRITQYLVKGSCPHNLITYQNQSLSVRPAIIVDNNLRGAQVCQITSGWALIIACLLVRCGSSVYDQKNWSLSKDFGLMMPEADNTML